VSDLEKGSSDASFDRVTEVNALLSDDQSLMGTIWRRHSSGMTAGQIAEAEGSDPINVYGYLKLIKAFQDGSVPTGPSVARGYLGRVRKWIKTKPLSADLRAALEEQRDALETVADNPVTREQEDQDAAQVTEQVISRGEAGIYVYTLPHYIRYPYDVDTGKTLLKVGHSSRDTLGRFEEQTRVTALPEDPVLLRIYPVSDSAKIEREFHAWLVDADHSRPSSRRGGSEWFVTSTRFLDRIAHSLGLEIRIINPQMDIDET
jgi:T5orf172 domain